MNTRMSANEELHLIALAQAGNREAEERLVIAHLRPAYVIVNRYARRTGVPKEDLEQEAALGLLTAVRKFDPAHEVRLVTYALWWVRVRVQRACRAWYHFIQESAADGARWLNTVPEKKLPPQRSSGILLSLLAELKPKRRQAIEMVLGLNGYHTHTREEMAAALGLQLSAANKLYIRTLSQLRRWARLRGYAPRRAA